MQIRPGWGRRLPSRAGLGCAAIGVLAALAGCGGSAPVAPPPVHVSLTAPIDGAKISSRHLVVLGTVDPAGAVVTVAGTPTRVTNNTFRRRISLGWGVHAINVEATAPGYLPTARRVVVHNEPYRVVPVPRHHGGAPKSPPAFVRQANAACAAGQSASLTSAWSGARHFARTGGDPAQLRRAIASSGNLLTRLQRIRVPAQSGPSYAAFLAAYQASVDGMNVLLADSAARPAKVASDISALSSSFRTAQQLGYPLGLQVCTNGRLAY
jgi:Glucodextranase, domain B